MHIGEYRWSVLLPGILSRTRRRGFVSTFIRETLPCTGVSRANYEQAFIKDPSNRTSIPILPNPSIYCDPASLFRVEYRYIRKHHPLYYSVWNLSVIEGFIRVTRLIEAFVWRDVFPITDHDGENTCRRTFDRMVISIRTETASSLCLSRIRFEHQSLDRESTRGRNIFFFFGVLYALQVVRVRCAQR